MLLVKCVEALIILLGQKRDLDLLRVGEVFPLEIVIYTYDIDILSIDFPLSFLNLIGSTCTTQFNYNPKSRNEDPK